jgi:hypothetical protein
MIINMHNISTKSPANMEIIWRQCPHVPMDNGGLVGDIQLSWHLVRDIQLLCSGFLKVRYTSCDGATCFVQAKGLALVPIPPTATHPPICHTTTQKSKESVAFPPTPSIPLQLHPSPVLKPLPQAQPSYLRDWHCSSIGFLSYTFTYH